MEDKSEMSSILTSAANLNSNISMPVNTAQLSVEDNGNNASGLQQSSEKSSIKAIIKHSGEITGYELSNGEKITKERGVELAKSGLISGVSVSTSRKGEEYLRSLRDDDESNNLNSLLVVEE